MGYTRGVIKQIAELETVFDTFAPESGDRRAREHRVERMRLFLSFLGNPEKAFRTYHIAGSKGKGSTASYLSAIITGYGRKCGLYTSPHLFSVRERFTLSGAFFSDSLYINTCNKLLEKTGSFIFPSSQGPEKPTTFEMYTAFAYILFKEAGCTDAVIETGLGGRLDATNTIESEAVFITEIELEHQDVLGKTIREIAKEKAGIIVSDAPVFASCHDEDAKSIMHEKAKEMGAPYYHIDDYVKSFHTETLQDGEHTSFSIGNTAYSLTLSMPTHAMAENAALALLGGSVLSLITDSGIRKLEKTQLPGRFEKRRIGESLIVIDTAHTPVSAAASCDAFCSIARQNPVLILGLVSGKDEEGIIKALFHPFTHIIITKPSSYRKSDPRGLLEKAARLFPEKDISLIENPDEALDSALSLSSDILITGSFYLASEMERLRKQYEP